jgi:hypothetical protein
VACRSATVFCTAAGYADSTQRKRKRLRSGPAKRGLGTANSGNPVGRSLGSTNLSRGQRIDNLTIPVAPILRALSLGAGGRGDRSEMFTRTMPCTCPVAAVPT